MNLIKNPVITRSVVVEAGFFVRLTYSVLF